MAGSSSSQSQQAEAEAEAEAEAAVSGVQGQKGMVEKGGPYSSSKKRAKGTIVAARTPNNEKKKGQMVKSARKSVAIWKECDEITFLEHLVAVCNERKCIPRTWAPFYEIVRPQLKDDYSNEQLYNKKRSLEGKFYTLKEKAEDEKSGGLDRHEQILYTLASQAWGRWEEENVKKKKKRSDEKAARATNEQVGNPKEQSGEEEDVDAEEEEMMRGNESLEMGSKEVEAAVSVAVPAAVDDAEHQHHHGAEREREREVLNPPNAAQDQRSPVRKRRREEDAKKKKKKRRTDEMVVGTNEQVGMNPKEQRGEEEEAPMSLPRLRAEKEVRRENESLEMARKEVEAEAAVAAALQYADHHDDADREREREILNYLINPPQDYERPPVRRRIVPANTDNNKACSCGSPRIFEEMCKASLEVHNVEMLKTYERITAAVVQGVKEVESTAQRRKKELEAVSDINHLDSSLLSKLFYSRKMFKLSQSEEQRFADKWQKQNDVEMRAAEGRAELMLEEHRARMAEAGPRQ